MADIKLALLSSIQGLIHTHIDNPGLDALGWNRSALQACK